MTLRAAAEAGGDAVTLKTLASELDFLGLWSAADRLREAETLATANDITAALDNARREVWGASLAVSHLAKRRPPRGDAYHAPRQVATQVEVAYVAALELLWERLGVYRWAAAGLVLAMRAAHGARYNAETFTYEASP